MKHLLIRESRAGAPCDTHTTVPLQPDDRPLEMQLIQLYPDVPRQTFDGFGGGFTPAAAQIYAQMSPALRREFLQALLDPVQGLGYTWGRISVAACDFSPGNYSYQDNPQSSFSLVCDEPAVLPFLQDVQKDCPGFRWMASTWSPPAWMKTNGQMCGGGALRPECRKDFARYLTEFLGAYARRGIPVRWLTIQNEPQAVQTWESCLYTAREEAEFLTGALRPALAQAGLADVRIAIWDHNKEGTFARARAIFSDPAARDAADGIAFHWYSGDHFENLALCREFFPEKELIFTEGSVELTGADTVSARKAHADGGDPTVPRDWLYAECYGHDLMGNLNHGMQRWMDWNVLLDEQGGPNHVGNYCAAPLLFCGGGLRRLPIYTVISHFSRSIRPGARRMAHSRYTTDLDVTAWQNPDGSRVCIVLNTTDRDLPFFLKNMQDGFFAPLTAHAHSILTLCEPGGD